MLQTASGLFCVAGVLRSNTQQRGVVLPPALRRWAACPNANTMLAANHAKSSERRRSDSQPERVHWIGILWRYATSTITTRRWSSCWAASTTSGRRHIPYQTDGVQARPDAAAAGAARRSAPGPEGGASSPGRRGRARRRRWSRRCCTAAGYRTGLYTSPHLERIEERIAIDGTICSHEQSSSALAARVGSDGRRQNCHASGVPTDERTSRRSSRSPRRWPSCTSPTAASMRPCWRSAWAGGSIRRTSAGRSVCDHHQHQLRPHAAARQHAGGHRRRKGGHHQAGRAGHFWRAERGAAGGDSEVARARPGRGSLSEAWTLTLRGCWRRCGRRATGLSRAGAGQVGNRRPTVDDRRRAAGDARPASGGECGSGDRGGACGCDEQGWRIPERRIRARDWPRPAVRRGSKCSPRRPHVILDVAHNVGLDRGADRSAAKSDLPGRRSAGLRQQQGQGHCRHVAAAVAAIRRRLC